MSIQSFKSGHPVAIGAWVLRTDDGYGDVIKGTKAQVVSFDSDNKSYEVRLTSDHYHTWAFEFCEPCALVEPKTESAKVSPQTPPTTVEHTQPPTRIYFTGADGSGKTTLVDYTARKYGLPMLNEIARNVLADGRRTFNEIRAEGSSASAFQKAVFERQFREEAKLVAPYVSDRSIDNLAYAVEHGRNFAELLRTIPADYITQLRASIVFVVRPQRSFRTAAATDPFRLLSEWDGQVRIDAHTEMLFKLFDVPFMVIAEASAAAREAQVDWCLAARGFKEVGQ